MISKQVIKWISMIPLVAFYPVDFALAQETPLTVTNVSQVRALSAADLERSPRVQLEAVVTLSVPARSYLWVQDARAGSLLFVRGKTFSVQLGDRVLITGTAVQGESGPLISPDQVKVLGHAVPPVPPFRSVAELNTFADQDRRVEAEGRVLRATEHTTRWQLELEASGGRFWVDLPRQTNDTTQVPSLVGATIRARGVCVRRLFEWGQVVQAAVLAQSLQDVSVVKAGQPDRPIDPAKIPVQMVSAVARDSATLTNSQVHSLVHLRGVVLDQRLGEHIVFRDSTGTILAECAEMTPLAVHEQVDVWGTPVKDGARLYLQNATFGLIRTNASGPTQPVAAPEQKPAQLPVLTRASDVRALSAEQAAWKFPVHLRGVVTLYYPQRRQFFVQDGSAGAFIYGSWSRTDVKPGDLVDINGVTGPGGFAPLIVPSKVTPSGTAAMPEARRVTLFQLATGQYDSQWVEVQGVVRSVDAESGLLRIKLSDADGTLYVNVPGTRTPDHLVDAVVRIRGVCASGANSRRQVSSIAIWSPSLDYLQIDEPGVVDSMALPTQTILSLSQFRPYDTFQRRVKVAGTVTVCQSPQSFFIQDESDGIGVQTSADVPGIKPGDRVAVAGYAAPGEYGDVLRDATCQIIGSGAIPAPKQLPVEHALDPQFHNLRVRADARVAVVGRSGMTLQLPAGIFEARFLAPLSGQDLPPVGSLIELTGVYQVLTDETRTANAFLIIIPSARDIQVLERPSWWSLQHTMSVVGVMAAIVLSALLWVLMLRRKVRDQTASLKDSETKFRSLVEQSLVGVYVIQEDRFCYVNPRLAQIFGYTVEEMQRDCTVADVVYDDDRSMVAEQMRRRVDGETNTVRYSFRGRRRDGSLVFVEVLGNRTEFKGKPAVLGTLLDVTERKRAEEDLFNSQQMLRTVLDTIPQRVFWKDRNSVYVGCNKALAVDCGYADPAELLGKTDYETRSAQAAEQHRRDDCEVMESGQPKLNYEEPQVRRDGSEGWLRTSKVPLFDADGKVIGVLGTYEDVTERKNAELALAEASSLLEMMLANSPDCIYFKDRESRFVRYSKSFEGLFKLSPGESLAGKTDFDFFLEEHARPAFEDEQEIIRTGNPMIGKLEKESHADGRVTWALTNKMPWRDKSGAVIGTFGISKDLTAIKKTEEQLAYERELFRALVEKLPDAIYFKDRESRFVRLSRSKVERARQVLIKRHREQHPSDTDLPAHLADIDKCSEYLVGKSDFDVYPADRAQPAYEEEQEILRSGHPLIGKVEKSTRAEDGALAWFLTTKMLWHDSQGNVIGTFGVTRDITALKEAEAQLESAHQRLMETSRLAGMAEVATDVLHNVGNVLNSVNVSCSLTIDRVKASRMGSLTKISDLLRENHTRLGEFIERDPRGQQIPDYVAALADHLGSEQNLLLRELEQLLKHIDHIKQIVAMQQNYAKVAGVYETVDPVQLVDDALHINAAALSRHEVKVQRDFGRIPSILTEKHKVLQILVNLIRNAKYALDDAKRSDKLLTLKVGQDGDRRVKIQVIDNGIGIPEENLTRIFSHGFTTRRNGHGFGLHSSALAVRELGGSLQAQSDGNGKGATFTLVLPCEPPDSIQKEL